VYFDTPVAKNNMFPFFPDVRGAPFNPIEAMSFLTRWTVDMASPSDGFEKSERLTDLFASFHASTTLCHPAAAPRLAARVRSGKALRWARRPRLGTDHEFHRAF